MGEFAKAVEHGIDNGFIHWAEEFGGRIARQVTTSQIRNVFGSVKKLEMSTALDMPELLLLKPRIAYSCSRDNRLADFGRELTDAIDAVDRSPNAAEQQQRFRRFCQGFEAILAYHRANGGK